MKWTLLLSLGYILSGCGGESFTEIFENQQRKDAVDALLYDAQQAYDSGDFELAVSKAEKAKLVDNSLEQARVIIAFSKLGLAGLDVFSLGRGLTTTDSKEEDKTSGALSSIAGAIGLTREDLESLSERVDEGDNLEVFVPLTVTEARNQDENGNNQLIGNIRSAISELCPLIPDAAKLLGDDGLSDSAHNCESFEVEGSYEAQALFAWATAHIGEAVSFYSLLFYKEANGQDPNLIARGKALSKEKESGDIAAYAAKLISFADLVDEVMPVDGSDSMLNALFNNLETTTRAFSSIKGLPEDFSKSIGSAVDDIKSRRQKIIDQNAQTDETSATNEALKNGLTKKLGSDIKKQIETLPADSEELASICKSYEKINSDPALLPQKCS